MAETQEPQMLTNAELELKADARGGGEVKRISYARLIARRSSGRRAPSSVWSFSSSWCFWRSLARI